MSTAPSPPRDPRERTARAQAARFLADALRQGKARQAVESLREQTGLGLEQARDAIEGTSARRASMRSDLSPGEVPRRPGWGRAVVVLLLLALLAWRWWGSAE